MKFKIVISILLAIMLSNFGSAVQFAGGKGLFFTQSPITNPMGQLSFNFYSRGFYKTVDPGDVIRHSVEAASFNFGFSRHIEVGMTQIIYQDMELKSEATSMIPGISLFHFKMGNFSIKSGSHAFYYALNLTAQYRTARYYDIYLEPYVNFGITGEADLILSYYWKPFYIYESPALHFNLGYKNHNDGESITESSQAIPFAVSYVRPNIKTEYSMEVHGEMFIQRPPATVFSREHFVYICPGFKYKIFMGMAIGLGLDVLVYTEDELSSANLLPSDDYPQYPEWRLNFKFDFVPSTGFFQVPTFEKVERSAINRETLRERKVVTEKKSLFEWIVDENKGAEYIDLELEKIREERKKAEEELEKLKRDIEKSEKGKKEQ